MRFLGLFLMACYSFCSFADDIVMLDDRHGKEVEVTGAALIKAHQKYTEAKGREASKNAPLQLHKDIRLYAQRTLRLPEAEGTQLADEFLAEPGGKERLNALGDWYTFALGADLRMQAPQALVFAKKKSQLPVPKNMIEAYRANMNYARRDLRLPEEKAFEFSERMLLKLLPDLSDPSAVRNAGEGR